MPAERMWNEKLISIIVRSKVNTSKIERVAVLLSSPNLYQLRSYLWILYRKYHYYRNFYHPLKRKSDVANGH